MIIILNNQKAFKWHTNETLYFKGYFHVNSIFYEQQDAFNYLLKIKTHNDFKETLNNINGVFTFIVLIEGSYYITSDITRSFPIFYTFQNDEFLISDDILYLKNNFKINDFDTLSEVELKSSNHTHGKKTLLKNVFQIQASEYLIIKKKVIKDRKFFYSYAIKKENLDAYKTLKNKAILTFEGAFQRLISSLNNKTVVIPLSGGFDSRLIAVMLKKHKYTNVVCYTYGRKDSFEIKNSKKTAEFLGFKWLFIEYTPELIKGFLETDEFKEYVHFAGKLSSMPYLQEYFAVKYLKENKVIPENSIFIPGYAGDILGGSEYLKTIPKNINQNNISKIILKKKMVNYHFSENEKLQIEAEISKNLFLFDNNYQEKIPETVFDDYNIRERISKFIFNSACFYSFFGHEFRFPFWDKELLDFFKKVPIKYKFKKTFYDDVLINEYFEPNNVNFEHELQPSAKAIYIQKIKNQIKPFLPTVIKQYLIQKNDWMNYKPITNQMLTKLESNGLIISKLSKNYNEIITQWYLYYSKNKIK